MESATEMVLRLDIDGDGAAQTLTLPVEVTPGREIVTIIPTESALVLHDWDGTPLAALKPNVRRTFRWRRGRWRCEQDRRARLATARRLRQRKHGWR